MFIISMHVAYSIIRKILAYWYKMRVENELDFTIVQEWSIRMLNQWACSNREAAHERNKVYISCQYYLLEVAKISRCKERMNKSCTFCWHLIQILKV